MSIPLDLWGQRGWPSAEVAGESHYAGSIRGLFGKDFKATGTEITVTAPHWYRSRTTSTIATLSASGWAVYRLATCHVRKRSGTPQFSPR
jgi:hypothetical protein